MGPYEHLMNAGNKALADRKFGQAVELFGYAANAATSADLRAVALQHQGAALRSINELAESKRSFNEALRIVEDLALAGRIKWGLGITLLQYASPANNPRQLEDAAIQFEESRKDLVAAGLTAEAAVSQGYHALVLLMSGQHDKAIIGFRAAHRGLTGQRNFDELENLIWLARVSPSDRWRLAPRAFKLMKLTGKQHMRTQYFGVLIRGGRLPKS